MAQEFALRFYKSTAWLKVRDYVLRRDNYLCTRCGAAGKIVHHKIYLTPDNIGDPFISLNPDNLETLCEDCHNAEHMGALPTASELTFTADGRLIKRD